MRRAKFGAPFGGHHGAIVYSSDGDRWELAADHDHLADEHLEAVAWSGERFVAVSYFDGTIMYSPDGDRWERATEIATGDTLEDVTWGNGRFVAVRAQRNHRHQPMTAVPPSCLSLSPGDLPSGAPLLRYILTLLAIRGVRVPQVE